MTNTPSGYVAVVIPVFNEAPVIGDVIRHVLSQFPMVVAVDDGSGDGSAQEIAHTGAHLVRHPLNLGQGAALQTGIDYALLDPRVTAVVTFDADGQHRVEDALALVAALDQHQADIVFGSRFLRPRSDEPAMRMRGLKLAARLANIGCGVRLTDGHSGLRAIRRAAAARLRIRQAGLAHATEIIHQVGRGRMTYVEVPVQVLHTEYSRNKGQSMFQSANRLYDIYSK